MRILIGSIAMVDQDDAPGITSPDYVVLRGKTGVVDTRWFYYWLRSPLGAGCIASLARGAVRERMLFNRLAEGSIDLPPFAVQSHTSETLATLRPLRTQAIARAKELERLPALLLDRVFSS
jgi:type I restriction enzyme S subunit